MVKGLYNPGKTTPAISSIEYQVNATGDTFFHPTIGSSDSLDYTASKAEALAQCKILSPLDVETVS